MQAAAAFIPPAFGCAAALRNAPWPGAGACRHLLRLVIITIITIIITTTIIIIITIITIIIIISPCRLWTGPRNAPAPQSQTAPLPRWPRLPRPPSTAVGTSSLRTGEVCVRGCPEHGSGAGTRLWQPWEGVCGTTGSAGCQRLSFSAGFKKQKSSGCVRFADTSQMCLFGKIQACGDGWSGAWVWGARIWHP